MASRNRIRDWLQTVLCDCRFAFRQVRKEPAVTATVVITLGLRIGVNTAMFSLLNGWLLRPLPVPSPQQVTVLASQQKEGSNGNFSYPDFLDFQRGDDSFSSLFGYAPTLKPISFSWAYQKSTLPLLGTAGSRSKK